MNVQAFEQKFVELTAQARQFQRRHPERAKELYKQFHIHSPFIGNHLSWAITSTENRFDAGETSAIPKGAG